MSHISSVGSRLRSESCDSTQREPHMPSPTTTPLRSWPAGVSPYSTAPPLPRETETMPAFSSSFNRLESSAGDMRGTPRLRSLKRVVPQSSSRRMSGVQREQNTSAAIETGQNCP